MKPRDPALLPRCQGQIVDVRIAEKRCFSKLAIPLPLNHVLVRTQGPVLHHFREDGRLVPFAGLDGRYEAVVAVSLPIVIERRVCGNGHGS